MVNLNDFNDINTGTRGRNVKTYIWVSGKNCTLNFGTTIRKDISKFFGPRVIVRANDDFTKFVLLRGDGYLIKNGSSVTVSAISDKLREKFGDNIHYLYFDGKWEDTDTGIKVYLLELCGKKYVEDATIRSVKA